MRCNKGNHSDQSDFEVGKIPNLDFRVTKTSDDQVRGGQGRPIRYHHSNHFDQSDFEDRETPNFDLTVTEASNGRVGGGSGATNGVSR